MVTDIAKLIFDVFLRKVIHLTITCVAWSCTKMVF